jgi:hypothetical protein
VGTTGTPVQGGICGKLNAFSLQLFDHRVDYVDRSSRTAEARKSGGGRDSACIDIVVVGLDFQPVSDELPVTIHRVRPIVPDLDSLIHLEALPKMVDYRLRDRLQFGEVMQPLKTFQ